MSAARKAILVAGLGRFAPQGAFPGGDGKNVQLVEDDMKRAADHGFDCTMLALNPEDLAGTLDELRETLASRHWDGLVFGFGLRGRKEYTVLFEDAVNTSREITPTTKLMFSTSPDGILESVQRAFPEAE